MAQASLPAPAAVTRLDYHTAVTTPPLRVLVVDDEENIRYLLQLILTRAGYHVCTATNGREALLSVAEVDIVLCDVRMPELDGLEFLAALPASAPPVVMMSAYGSVDLALEAMRRGAYDYVSKPFKADEIVLTLRKLEEREALARDRAALAVENARLAERVSEPVEGFIGRSPSVQELLRVLRRAAPHDSTVLFTGESGTGKEVLARALHRLSSRRDQPWVAVNCAAIPDALLESELFGHARGAFTGAVDTRVGLFEQAHCGTLFLDEIGDLPTALQGKLLRVLEDGVIRRLGSNQARQVDVRVVAASARPLTAPSFREDLYYRLAVVQLHLPPLRQRVEDIPLLIQHLLGALCGRMNIPLPRLSDEAMRHLLACPWPGNVRQLEHALERALLVHDGGVIQLGDLPGGHQADPPSSGDLSIPRHTMELERRLIAQALSQTGGNRAAAARLLELSYKALLYKIKEYELGN